MTISMTGFSCSELPFASGSLTWELRSVNHRFLDVHFRLPEDLRSIEMPCRQLLGKHLNRGRIEANLQYKKSYSDNISTKLNEPALKALMSLLDEIEGRYPNLKGSTSLNVLRAPGILDEQQENKKALSEKALEGLKIALEKLQVARQREGQKLEKMMIQRLDDCHTHISQLTNNLPLIKKIQNEKMQKKMEGILVEVNPDRIAQEIALLLTKSDVTEELDRLDSHLLEVRRLLESNQPVGRRVDFLMQELNRETNTLGSKSIDQLITNTSIELKVLIEQMREQIQNIE